MSQSHPSWPQVNETIPLIASWGYEDGTWVRKESNLRLWMNAASDYPLVVKKEEFYRAGDVWMWILRYNEKTDVYMCFLVCLFLDPMETLARI